MGALLFLMVVFWPVIELAFLSGLIPPRGAR